MAGSASIRSVERRAECDHGTRNEFGQSPRAAGAHGCVRSARSEPGRRMTQCSDQARVQIFVADYAASDPVGKINAIGIGFQFAGLAPTGSSAPQAVVGIVEIPAT